MEDNKELQGFDLDDILSEFQTDAAEGDALEAVDAELSSLLGDWDTSAEEISADTKEIGQIIAQASETAASAQADPISDTVTMDTTRMNDLIRQIEEENAAAEMAADVSAAMDARETIRVGQNTEAAAVPGDTIRLNSIAQLVAEAAAAPQDDPTIRISVSEAEAASDTEEMPAREASPEEEPRIIYNPRTRLRELKKKLVAGPEKRYYELSEQGVGRLQAAMLLNLAIVALCVLTSTLFALEMIPVNRLRFVIFSQVLAMLLSAFFGCQQMLDGLGDLFKGRFTINTLLTFTFAACCADAVFCLSELRIPCCAAFSLEISMALWARYHRFTTEMNQMDSLRKAVRLNALVKSSDCYPNMDTILRRDGELEDFMDHYNRPSGPERLQNIYAFLSMLLCIGIAVFSGMNHGTSMALQILSASLLVAVPASFFIALTRPAALLQRRLHMVGTVLCGWKGAKGLCGKAIFPLRDEDLFPVGTTKLNGVKYYGDRNPDEVLSYATSLISVAGGGLVPVFRQMLSERTGREYSVENFRNYGSGGIGGEVDSEPVLMGSLDFLQDMGVEIPEGTMVSQAVYTAIDGQLCAVFAISYAKMRSAAAGLISLCSTRKIKPVLTGNDFMLTGSLLRAKFSVNTRRILFPEQEVREALAACQPDPEAPSLALATRDDLVSYAYAVSGARALCTAMRLGAAIHLIGGIVGILIMAAIALLGNTDLLTPTNILLYQLIWLVPGFLITEWARTA